MSQWLLTWYNRVEWRWSVRVGKRRNSAEHKKYGTFLAKFNIQKAVLTELVTSRELSTRNTELFFQ